MANDRSILVCGIGETPSAVARSLHAEGYLVALYRATPPSMLRRRMCFADAWHDGYALLDGVEARRADVEAEVRLGLRTREFIPLLRGRYADALARWPWDVIVAAQEDREPATLADPDDAELTIGLGAGLHPGRDCHLIVETDGPDPGAIRRDAPASQRRRRDAGLEHRTILAPAAGLFRAKTSIGAAVQPGAPLGAVGDSPVLAPMAGRVVGLARKEQAVVDGAPVAELAASLAAPVAGISSANQLVCRGVSFAIEMAFEGFEPFSFEDWF